MRVAITGAHGTGKTTLSRVLSQSLGLPMIEEVARKIIWNSGFQTTRDYINYSEASEREQVQKRILVAQKDEEKRLFSGFISDRSVFDSIAYSAVYGVHKTTVNRWLGWAISYALETYHLLVYVPPMIPLQSDGFRDVDEELQEKVDKKIKQYVDAFAVLGGNVLVIEEEDLEARVNKVIWKMARLSEKHGTM